MVFARTSGGLIDFSSALAVNNKGAAEQRITTISGKPMELVMKPDSPASSVTGLITLKSLQNAEILPSQNTFASLFNAALSAANPPPVVKNSTTGVLVQKFAYVEVQPGVFKTEINAPTAEGEYEVTTIVSYKDASITPTETKLITVVDPEGYVYQQVADGKLRIENANVSIYWLNPDTKKYEPWQAEKFLQKNPILTDDTGKYSFLVPQGTYYLTASATNYANFKSVPFEIKEDNGVRIDIELKKKTFLPDWFNWEAVIAVLLFLVVVMLGVMIVFSIKKGRIKK